MNHRLRRFSTLAALLVPAATFGIAACRAAPPPPAATTATSPAVARVATLRHGIAIWRWFDRPAPETDSHYAGYVSDSELRTLRRWGFTAVRLPVGEPFLFADAAGYGRVLPARMQFLLASITRINAAGLAVVVDFHPDSGLKARMESDAGLRDKTVAFWGVFAKALSGTDPDRVMLELLNEPRFIGDEAGWNRYVVALHAAARAGAPRHTIVVDSARYAAFDSLEQLQPLNDPNVIYSVHFYEPMDFTGQGLPWLNKVPNLTWPNDGLNCGASINAKETRNVVGIVAPPIGVSKGVGVHAQRSCTAAWTAAKMDAQVAGIADWARRNRLPVWIGEFGVRGEQVPPDARLRWFAAATQAFTAQRLPSSLWSYDDCWGLSMKVPCLGTDGRERSSAASACATLQALGLGGPECIADLRRLNLPAAARAKS